MSVHGTIYVSHVYSTIKSNDKSLKVVFLFPIFMVLTVGDEVYLTKCKPNQPLLFLVSGTFPKGDFPSGNFPKC